MKRLSLIVLCVAAALYVSAAARVPDLGNPSIVVLANIARLNREFLAAKFKD